MSIESLFRPSVQQLAGYVPGEQPQDSGWIKLNTNENPYPPSPRVIAAIQEAANPNLSKYPDPLATRFRQVAADLLDVEPDWILPANGSDENLTILLRTFVDSTESVSFPYPSYVLYGTLANIQGANYRHLPLNSDWTFHSSAETIAQSSKLVFVPNPNSPSGHCWSHDELQSLIPEQGVFVLDEAYGDFQQEPHRVEFLRLVNGDRCVLTRSFSKSYSLAGIRFGYAVAHPDLIAGMQKVKDSYNCDAIAIAAATAALEDQSWMQQNREKICQTREHLARQLTELGFRVLPSQANFLWTEHKTQSHETIYEQLKSKRILVRYMKFPHSGPQANEQVEGLRITIGTDEQTQQLVNTLQNLL